MPMSYILVITNLTKLRIGAQNMNGQNESVVQPIVVDTTVAETLNVTVVDTTVAETPVVETAEVETPVVETAEVETPVVETAEVETPAVETAAVETPAVETPEETISPVEMFASIIKYSMSNGFSWAKIYINQNPDMVDILYEFTDGLSNLLDSAHSISETASGENNSNLGYALGGDADAPAPALAEQSLLFGSYQASVDSSAAVQSEQVEEVEKPRSAPVFTGC